MRFLYAKRQIKQNKNFNYAVSYNLCTLKFVCVCVPAGNQAI